MFAALAAVLQFMPLPLIALAVIAFATLAVTLRLMPAGSGVAVTEVHRRRRARAVGKDRQDGRVEGKRGELHGERPPSDREDHVDVGVNLAAGAQILLEQ